jgi:uncharacterized protein involved in exopolysaccharide biosynthesis
MPSNHPVPQSRAASELVARAQYASGPGPSSERRDDDEALIDVKLAGDLVRFVLNAIGRHKLAVALVFLGFLSAGVLSAVLLPKQYYAETKVLADRNVVMPLLGNPGRPNTDADTPTRLASDLIMTRANLVRISQELNLLGLYESKRPFLSRIKRQVRNMIKGPLTDEEKLGELIWTLRTKMNVRVGEGTVIVGVVWSDPELAFKIVQAAEKHYLADREEQELAMITGTISILERSAAELGKDINRMLDSLGRQRSALAPDEARGLLPPPPVAPTTNPTLLAAQANLESVVRSIAELEQYRSRRLNELQSLLSEQRITFGAEHPQIESTQQLIKSLSSESPQLAQLREEEQKLRQLVTQLGGSAVAASVQSADQSFAAVALRNMASMRVDSIVQEKQAYGRSRLRIAMSSYQALLERLDAARIELETVRATFSFKYGVLIPASVPKDPIGLKWPIMVAVAGILGVILAVATAVLLDIIGRRVLESWQIERGIGLPVLGEAPLALKP